MSALTVASRSQFRSAEANAKAPARHQFALHGTTSQRSLNLSEIKAEGWPEGYFFEVYTWRRTRSHEGFWQVIGTVWTLVLLGLTQTGFASGDRMGARERLLAMDDEMKPAQMEAMEPGGSNTRQQHDHGEMFIRTEKMMRGQIGVKRPAHATELAEERIAFLKAELGITKKRMAEWNALALALRSGRQHLAESRKLTVLDDKTPFAERLEHYERHLTERLEAVKSTRAAFTRLYPTLNDVQKQTADAILLPLIATF